MHHCPLCLSNKITFYHEDKSRCYWQCDCCQLVFVTPELRLDEDSERAHYQHRQNNPFDLGYRRFLSRLSMPLLERIPANSTGLDFGCGPGPALAQMLTEVGHNISLYDVYYQTNKNVLTDCYDFLTATEVIEHLCNPNKVWQQWLNLVKPGGWIAIMTKMVTDHAGFANWHYKLDPTHVIFFSRATFEYLAKRDQLELTFFGEDVILLSKSNE